ncbi:MAG: hypothetical protein ACLFWM_02120 [Actinomycetota bacterium]
MVAPSLMVRAAIDIGTNSVRLLVAGERGDMIRRTTVTGLGRGLRATGRLSAEGRASTRSVLESYRREMSAAGVTRVRAVMTAAGRAASDVGEFLDEAAQALGFRPEVIGGDEEARLSYAGSVADLEGDAWTVVDIGGGSTEVVGRQGGESYEIGSVVLTDEYLADRPVAPARLEAARDLAASLISPSPAPDGVVGVAGTWTSLAAMSLALEPYDPDRVHHHRLTRAAVEEWVDRLSGMGTEDTARLPGLDPARAPVILGGSIAASAALAALQADSCLVSERDLLDGVLASLG